MKLKVLGTRGEIPSSHPKHVRHAGILIDDKILLDLGEREFLEYDPLCIFITHLHKDHAIFLTSGERITADVPVYAPETSDKLKGIRVISGSVKIEGYEIIPIPVIHSTNVKSFGYLVRKNKKRLFYTGDIASIRRQYFRRIGKLDAVITEASFSRKGGLVRKNKQGEMFGHAGVPDLINVFQKFTNRIIFTHFGTWFIKNASAGIQKIESMKTTDLKIDIAFDGAEYSV